MLQKAVPNRQIHYEVAALREGRWLIECLREAEAEAIDVARMFLKLDGIEAVRVTRARSSPGDIVFETPVFEQSRPPQGKPILRVSATDDQDAWCDTLEDLYGGRSRRAISQLLRSFLDQMGITATELLHNYRYGKKLDSMGSLRVAAAYKIAQARADQTGLALPMCSGVLEELIAAASGKARDAMSMRGIPRLGEGGLDQLIPACQRLVTDPVDQMFYVRHTLSRTLEPMASLGERAQAVLEWRAGATTPAAQALIDEIISDCLGSGTLVQDMLGRQPDLGSALVTLTDLARGQLATDPVAAPPWFAGLRQLLADQPCPEIRAVLIARVRRELAGDQPLNRGNESDMLRVLNQVTDKLKHEAEGIFIGGGGIVEGLVKRWAKLDVPGGIGDIKPPKGKPEERYKALIEYEPTVYGDARKRAVATLMVDALRDLPVTTRTGLADTAGAIQASGLLPPARLLIARLLAGAS
ncbi:hypothetical protein [Desertibaculum subflavum]|uniref:hypothetical protein n=1 Tax=Desertibaculum subflavum TaxID=2268458 RepID=UPI000E669B92